MMRITAILMLAGLIHVSASVYSQKTNLELKLKDVSVEEVLQKIEEQSNFYFLYRSDFLKDLPKVSINVTGAKVEEILNQIVVPYGFGYEIDDKIVVIRKTSEAPVLNQQDQKITVKGKVTDSSGAPLPGVTVVIKGTTQGTITDTEGDYNLMNIPPGAKLLFSFVGMKTQEIAVGAEARLDVKMEDEVIGMDEVVVVGYGTQKKINLTGAVDLVSGEKLANRSAPNMALLMQGTSPNVSITLNAAGGEPGSSQFLNIRGVGSISGNDSPLVLVDGVEMSINLLDPESVESISILKDASASAVYGSRAAYGVILVTTKKGGKDKPLQIQYNNNLSHVRPIYIPDFADSYTFAVAFNQANDNAGTAHQFSQEQIERIKGWMDGSYPYPYNPESPLTSFWNGRYQGNTNVNWPKKFWSTSFYQKHNINLNGGTEKSQYYFTVGLMDQPGLYTWGKDKYTRYNILSNYSSQVNDWFQLNFNTKYARTDTDYPIGVVGNNPRYHIWQSFLSLWPTQPEYYLDGTPAHPYQNALERGGRIKTISNDMWLNLGTELEPVKGWKTTIKYNYNCQWSNESQDPKPVIIAPSDTPAGNIGASTYGSISEFSQRRYWLFQIYSAYEKMFGKHYMKGLIGYEKDYNNYAMLNGSKMDLITPEVVSISTATGTITLDDRKSHWATQGIFGRLNYNFDEKYLLEFSARYDGSSRFAPDSRWGFFPSFSAGYNIARESFWLPIEPYINTLKFRMSYGSLGNQNVDNYLYLSTIPFTTPTTSTNYIIDDEIRSYAKAPGLISSDITWEKITTLDIGLDAELLQRRLSLVCDWYERITSDMIGPTPQLPLVLGTSTPSSNNAKLSTKGIELSVSWKDRISSDFSYGITVGLGDYTSTILEYYNETGNINTWYPTKKHGEIWGYTTDGIIQTTEELETMPDQSYIHARWTVGDMKYKDLTGEGKIAPGLQTLDDHGDLSVIGNTNPRYNYNISVNFSWKNIDFSMFWQGIGKQDLYPGKNGRLETFFGFGRSAAVSTLLKDGVMLDYWRPANETNILGPNTDAFFAKPYIGSEFNKNTVTQSRFVLNAAYLRLKNLQVGYTIPQNLLSRFFIKNARIYVSGENLITFSPLPKAYEPETSVVSNNEDPDGYATVLGQIYPITQMFSIGVNLTF